MRTRVVTLTALGLLLLCAASWARSYLPPYFTLRAHRGALYGIFYDQRRAYFIDPVNHPTREYAQGVSRWDTAEILHWARLATPPDEEVLAAVGLGFEFRAVGPPAAWRYFVVAVPFWALCLPPAIAAAWGGALWRRRRRWERTGRCRTCGYDLYGSAGACPECGTVAPS